MDDRDGATSGGGDSAADRGLDAAISELTRDLARWAGESRQREAAAARSRRRWLEQQAAEEATFVAVLLAVAEARIPVVLGVANSSPVRGLVAAVGRDFCAVRAPKRGTVLVSLGDITDARVQPGHQAIVGTQGAPGPADMSLSDVLFGLAGERPEVVVSLRRGGDPVSGELRTVGQDVATVRTGADPPVTVYVPLAAISQLGFRL